MTLVELEETFPDCMFHIVWEKDEWGLEGNCVELNLKAIWFEEAGED